MNISFHPNINPLRPLENPCDSPSMYFLALPCGIAARDAIIAELKSFTAAATIERIVMGGLVRRDTHTGSVAVKSVRGGAYTVLTLEVTVAEWFGVIELAYDGFIKISH